jgi:endonuclease G
MQISDLASMRRLLGATVAGVVLAFGVPAHGSTLGGLVERAVEQQISKHFSQQAAPPVSLPPAGSFAGCRQLFPKGAVLDVAKVERQWGATALCSNHFAALHSGLSKTPLLVVERLSRAQMAQALDEARTDEFYADPRLPTSARAELEDYRGSGLDRGHLAPAGDQPNPESMAQSFALSNMVPQDPTNNRKAWAKIESDVRKFARRAQGDVYVFSGPLFRGEQRTIGRNRVWVPSHLFKLVYDEASGRSWAYVLANTAEARVGAPVDYPEFVRQTGWQLLGRSPG